MSVIEECIKAVQAISLNISSTRRSGENGLRNADELVMCVLTTLAGKLDEKGLEAAYSVDCMLPEKETADAIQAYLNQLINEEKE